MKLRVQNADLSRELALLEKIVGQKPTIAVLANVLIQTGPGVLVLSATDLELGLVGACNADIEEQGSVTLPARKLMELVRAQSDATLTLSSGPKGSVLFTSGGFASKLQSLPATDFPGIPSIEGHPSITLNRESLKAMLPQVRYGINEKGAKYFMNGAYMGLKENELALVTTDGARMSLSRAPREGEALDPVLIPSATLDELAALLNEEPQTEVVFAQSDRHLFFDLDGRLLVSRKIDGKFPNYERIIPKSNEHHMILDRLAVIPVLKRLVLINEIVILQLSAGQLTMSALSVEVGEGAERVDASYEGPTMEMRYKGPFLLDFLTTAKSTKVTLAVRDNVTAMIMQDGAGDYMGVVMGMLK